MAEVPYWDWQVAREMTGTETFLRVAGRVVPSSVRRPLFYSESAPIVQELNCQEVFGTYQPATVRVVPEAGSEPEAGRVA